MKDISKIKDLKTNYKELEEEVKFYSRENFMKQRRIEQLQKEIRDLKKEGIKNEKKNTKTKSFELLNK